MVLLPDLARCSKGRPTIIRIEKQNPPLIIIIIIIMLISAGAGECDELDIIIKVLRPRMSLWHFATPPASSTAANA